EEHLEQNEKVACPNRTELSCIQSTPTEISPTPWMNSATCDHLRDQQTTPQYR
ncbi:hypothetical protein KUCAC02_028572, partial [Chaenocephalus aceratus]